jgi:sulfite reductase (NADPH) flavoprotein alpha-component
MSSHNLTEESLVAIGSRQKPVLSTIKERFFLTKNSERTLHITLDLAGQNLPFLPGDSLGILPRNHPLLVQALLQAFRASGKELIEDPKTKKSLTFEDFLSLKANISRTTSALLNLVLENTDLSEQDRQNLLTHYEPTDVLLEFASKKIDLQQASKAFAPLLPRFYSIASSPKIDPNEIHLTVAISTYEYRQMLRYGVASYFLGYQAKPLETIVPVFLQKAHHFRLPESTDLPLIMIGPGTGVAPFRAFMQERASLNAQGAHWLFFGERTFDHDYFYKDFWESHQAKGNLRLSLAFSRDQKEKIYVQHRILQEGVDLWKWLQEGAYLYICGDAAEMAKDVEKTLLQIFMTYGAFDEMGARGYLKELRKQKRYLLDVY